VPTLHAHLDESGDLSFTTRGSRYYHHVLLALQRKELPFKIDHYRPAKGGNPIPVSLNDDMVFAWKRLLPLAKPCPKKGQLPFRFDTSDYDKKLYEAGWPRHIRPYNAKHTVGITLAESGAEWEDIKDWFGHTDVKTTRIYTGLVASRLRQTGRLLEGRLGFEKLAPSRKRGA
jgi:integrase